MVLKGGALRAVARQMIPQLAAEGLSRNASIMRLQSVLGTAPRKTTFLKDWSQIMGLKQKEQAMRFTPKKYFPEIFNMTPSAGKLGADFQYIFKAIATNLETGKKEPYYVSLLTDDRLRVGTSEEMMQRILEETEDEYLKILLALEKPELIGVVTAASE